MSKQKWPGITRTMERLGSAVRRAEREWELLTDVRYQIRPLGRKFEIWDTQSDAIHGPFKSLGDAQVWIRRNA